MTEKIVLLSADFSKQEGSIRPLHGVNRGPLCNLGTTDLSNFYRTLRIPSVRLHDCPYAMPGTVDIACIFPVFEADADDAANYRFTQTDDFIQAIKDVGADVVYRLGPSIEHMKSKSHILPPPDATKWARICVNIIRHYNEGWANGFHHNIKYWEIWNEPDIAKCWAGTEDEFTHLFLTAGPIIKAHDASLKVGGPALAMGGKRRPFLLKLLAACRDNWRPDFFSWHGYIITPHELCERAKVMRELLDEHGMKETESHCNEWNFIPRRDWVSAHGNDGVKRSQLFQEIVGPSGAALVAATLIFLQDSSVDVANFYGGDSGRWGLFDPDSATNKTYFAMLAFSRLLETPKRCETTGNNFETGVAVCAGLSEDDRKAAILVSNFGDSNEVWDLALRRLPWQAPSRIEKRVVNSSNDLTLVKTEFLQSQTCVLRVTIPSSTVCLFTVAPDDDRT